MARKLWMVMVVALVSLVLLAQAAPGLAVSYSLANLGDSTHLTWTESRPDYPPGSAGTTFRAWSNSSDPGQDWKIPNLSCDPSSTTYTPVNDYWVKVTITYTTLQPNSLDPKGTPLFAASRYYDTTGHLITDKPIISQDAVITTTAVYKSEDYNPERPASNGNYIIYDQLISLNGSGHDSLNKLFTFAATLKEVSTDHTHSGYIQDFTITYPDPAPTPIPGAVWLLATGLLGLGFMRRRGIF